MKVVVPREIREGEHRVALVPDACAKLVKAGAQVLVEAGAGVASGRGDEQYTKVGATIESNVATLYSQADVLLKVTPPTKHPAAGQHEIDMMGEGAALISFLDPLSDFDVVRRLVDRQITAFSMELIPRITRAQSMDALSSMANIAGYKAVLIAADTLVKMFPMMMTAAGTISAARVFVIGAGVAGLQAIATAKRLGAIVSGYDVRPAVREQVQSLGAKFVSLELEASTAEDKGGYAKELGEEFYRKQREMMARVVAEHDVVITTAAIPGKKAPILITAEMVRGMQPGSVVVDLAAERGGNCELTRLDERVEENGVIILGPGNLPATVPYHASQMYSRNISTLLLHLMKDGALTLDMSDDITVGCTVTRGGSVVHPKVREVMGLDAGPASQVPAGEGSTG
jgi:NAD(P) transhydrogenase subunit alpha